MHVITHVYIQPGFVTNPPTSVTQVLECMVVKLDQIRYFERKSFVREKRHVHV